MRKPNHRGRVHPYFNSVVLSYDGDECLHWPYARSGGRGGGYGLINIDGRSYAVHRLVCESFNGPPPTPRHQAAHSCGKGHLGCVSGKHLSWKTPKENINDKFVHGTMLLGERSPVSKLTETQVKEIISLRGKRSPRDLGKEFGVSGSTISMIHTGDRWGWLERPDYVQTKPGYCFTSRKLTEEQVLRIREAFEFENVAKKKLARTFGVDPACIRAIIARKIWKDVQPRA